MKDILCLHCTRTGTTREIMEYLAAQLGADTARVTDGIDRSGPVGYAGAGFSAIRRTLPEILAVNTPRPVPEYGAVVLGAPIWAETVCPLAKSFLQRYALALQGKVYYVITHMSQKDYRDQLNKLDVYLGEAHAGDLSLCTKNMEVSDWRTDAAAFAKRILMAKAAQEARQSE